MKKLTTSLVMLLLLTISTNVNAQFWKLFRSELEVGIGGAWYIGDIGAISSTESMHWIKSAKLSQVRPGTHFGYRYKFSERFWARGNFNYGWFYGSDQYGSNESREMEFASPFIETSFQAEFAIIKDRRYNNYLMMKGKPIIPFISGISVYAFAGIGDVYFAPRVFNDPYAYATPSEDISRWAAVFPVGFGFKYGLTMDWTIELETGGRFTTTDLLDGFGANDYSRANDTYHFVTLSVIYHLETFKRGLLHN